MHFFITACASPLFYFLSAMENLSNELNYVDLISECKFITAIFFQENPYFFVKSLLEMTHEKIAKKYEFLRENKNFIYLIGCIVQLKKHTTKENYDFLLENYQPVDPMVEEFYKFILIFSENDMEKNAIRKFDDSFNTIQPVKNSSLDKKTAETVNKILILINRFLKDRYGKYHISIMPKRDEQVGVFYEPMKSIMKFYS